jgi:signal transduction histidine kinase
MYQWRVRQVSNRLHFQFEERLAERTRIAQDLHDTLLQGVVSASMQLDVAVDQLPADSPAKTRLNRIVELIGEVIEEGRNTLQGLRTSNTHSSSVNLEHEFSRIRQDSDLRGEIDFRVIVEGSPRILHPVIGDEVFHICREALINAFHHSEAKYIEVEITYAARNF